MIDLSFFKKKCRETAYFELLNILKKFLILIYLWHAFRISPYRKVKKFELWK